MSQTLPKASEFTMKPAFKSFIPQTTSNSQFTPVSPITPDTQSQRQQNMSVTANPFAFSPSESTTFVPTTQAPQMNDSRQFYPSENFDE